MKPLLVAAALLVLPASAAAQADAPLPAEEEDPAPDAPVEDVEAEVEQVEEPAAPTPDTEPAPSGESPADRPRTTSTRPPSTPRPRPTNAAPRAQPRPRVVVQHVRSEPEEEEEEEEEVVDGTDHYDIVWLEPFFGLSFVDLRALDANNYYPSIVRLQGEGPAGGAAIGFRVEFISVGARAAIAHYGDDFDVGTVVAEATLMLPLPVVKPYLRVGIGFGWHGDSDFSAPDMSQTTVFGFAVNGALGLDIYLADWFAIGAAVNVDFLNMNRQPIDGVDPTTSCGVTCVEFSESGDAVGVQARGQGTISFHL